MKYIQFLYVFSLISLCSEISEKIVFKKFKKILEFYRLQYATVGIALN